jgi:hypothetical protein
MTAAVQPIPIPKAPEKDSLALTKLLPILQLPPEAVKRIQSELQSIGDRFLTVLQSEANSPDSIVDVFACLYIIRFGVPASVDSSDAEGRVAEGRARGVHRAYDRPPRELSGARRRIDRTRCEIADGRMRLSVRIKRREWRYP